MHITKQTQSNSPIIRSLVYFGLGSTGIALLGFIYTGSFMRYLGDDYCYGGMLTKYGFWGSINHSYLNPGPFHGNRYSLTVFSELFGLFPPQMNGVLPGLVILLWVLSLALLFQNLRTSLFKSLSKLETWLIASLLVFFTLFTATDLPDSIYWRSGMLPYGAPIVTGLFLFAGIQKGMQFSNISWMRAGILFLLAFLSGGFSETATAIQFTVLIIWLFNQSTQQQTDRPHRQTHQKLILAALAGTVLAMFLLYISPATRSKLSEISFLERSIQAAGMSARHALDYLLGSLRGQPIPLLLVIISTFSLALLTSPRSKSQPQKIAPILGRLLFLGGICFLLISANMGPYAFARYVYPNERALLPAHFILILTLAFAGWLLGRYSIQFLFSGQKISKAILLIALLLQCGVYLYGLRAASQTFPEASVYQTWSSQWDLRDERIRTAISSGASEIEVEQIQSPLPGGGELKPSPRFWYNGCAAKYYGIKSISASLPITAE
jgi:hypothetical protein